MREESNAREITERLIDPASVQVECRRELVAALDAEDDKWSEEFVDLLDEHPDLHELWSLGEEEARD